MNVDTDYLPIDSIGIEDTSSYNGTEPDADSIKLFVGQIPRELTENDLRQIFEKHGPIYQLARVKDRNTQEYKGCAFLTYFKRQSAIDAQNALHGKKSFPGLKGLMQVKPANSEVTSEEERKLFVGMIPKSMTDEELQNIFQPFGSVEDCVILKDKEGVSKGCAFVIFATKKSAINSIKALNNVKKLEGAIGPMVVKFAETQREKEMKKRGIDSNMYSQGMVNQKGMSGTGGMAYNNNNYNAPNIRNPTAIAQNIAGMANPNFQNLGSALTAIASDPVLSAFLNPNVNLIQQLAQGNVNPGMAGQGQMGGLGGGYSGGSNINNNMGTPGNFGTNTNSQLVNWKNPGMDECNLFIFNIPENFRESELLQLFAPFGNIISSRVYYDKKTNKSKGFGFVSYDNAVSTKSAIQAMNGAHIGNRRIKVELKKQRMEGKPY